MVIYQFPYLLDCGSIVKLLTQTAKARSINPLKDLLDLKDLLEMYVMKN